MKPPFWHLVIAACVGAALLLQWRPGTPVAGQTGPEKLPTPRILPTQPQFVGAGSCAAAACHNANFTHGQKGSEYTLWITRDPHAKAYQVLFDDRSKQIQKNLQREVSAHEDQRCLSCHVAPAYDAAKPPSAAAYFKTDGVSCESCHGPANAWIARHHLDEWRSKTREEKKQFGMTDTQTLSGRAQVCVQCHVGTSQMEVDHDLIAAGHPRLHFEFAAFHAYMPRHWPDAKDRAGRPDLEARVWAVGQIASAHASLELLADRAADKKKPWPEFAEHDCSACHHDLSAKSAGKRVALPWADPSAMTPHALDLVKQQNARDLSDLLRRIRAGMAKSDRVAVEADARAAAVLLKPFLDADLPTKIPAHNLLRAILAEKAAGADAATQTYLAIAALASTENDLPRGLRLALQTRMRELNIPKKYDPEAIQKRLLE